ncbi:unnamed protein product [Schistosoma curassoni]|uniref:Chromo domain-containing protein n=1 Tax=Schistosoma curassoni TaxID=6186 RepID=A0A183KAV6_9TREM|nr:unnamed protein product [Schistosoma curassoni]
MRKLYDTTKKLAGKYSKSEKLIKDKERKPADVTPPTTEGIRLAIKQIKSGKAEGPNDIPPETLKSDIEITEKMRHVLFKKICDEEQVLMEWKKGYPIKIPKKGNVNNRVNCLVIILLSLPGKVFNRVVQRNGKFSWHLTSRSNG